MNLVRAQPVIEVFAKAAGSDVVREIAIRRRDQFALESLAGGIAHRMKRAGLDHAQQFHLDGRIQVAQFVEEYGSQLRTGFEPSLAVADRAGERAAAMAEQFGFHQRRRKRRNVDRKKCHSVVGEGQLARIERNVARLARWPAPPVPCLCRKGR